MRQAKPSQAKPTALASARGQSSHWPVVAWSLPKRARARARIISAGCVCAGLGQKEDGTTTHVKVKSKQNNLGASPDIGNASADGACRLCVAVTLQPHATSRAALGANTPGLTVDVRHGRATSQELERRSDRTIGGSTQVRARQATVAAVGRCRVSSRMLAGPPPPPPPLLRGGTSPHAINVGSALTTGEGGGCVRALERRAVC